MIKACFATLLLVAGGGAMASTSAPPSVESFMRHAAYSDVQISPGGKYLAISVDQGEQDVLTVLQLSDLSVVHVNRLPDKKSVSGFQWISDERLMFTAVRKVGSYAQPAGTGEWFAVNADGSQPRPVIFYGTRSAGERGKTVGNERFSLLDPLIDDPTDVLMMAMYQRSNDGFGSELVRVNTVSGARRSLGRTPRENCGITLDEKKEARYALCTDDEDEQGRYDIHTELYRREADGKWTLINRSVADGKQLSVLGTSDDGVIYASQGDRKAPDAFGTIDPATGAFMSLFQDPVSDVAALVTSPTDDRVLAVVTAAGAPKVHLVDEDHPDTALYAQLANAFPGQYTNFSSATRDGRKIIVSVRSDRNPGELYLYDRDTGQARFLLKRREWVDPAQSASIRSFSLTSRDGLKLHGYLTLPNGSDGKNLPMIVLPHGGPMGPRDSWGYNPETQLFASRGYAVLQVNFRGSGGFGKAFQDMAYGQWNTGIMNDILDATHWAIDQGIADRDRLCIYGGSFGGYSAMMAPAREPGLFKCAFGYVGNYSAAIQLRLSDTSETESGRRYQMRAYGATKALQDEMSPVTHAAKITLPVMLAAGARDRRCPPENTEAMRDALTAAGNPPEDVIIQSGEMHGFYEVANRVNLYTKMLDFFGRHIGGTAATGGAAEAGKGAAD